MASISPRGEENFNDRPFEATDIPNTHLEPSQPIRSTPTSSTPVEMSTLEPHPRIPNLEMSQDVATEPNVEAHPSEPPNPPQSASAVSALGGATSTPAEPSTLSPCDDAAHAPSPTGVPLTTQATNPAIGPSSDQPTPMPKETDSTGPTLVITLLLPTGARHPYRMDEKYLKKRNVNVSDNNPIHMSVYTLKELIWREWREGTNTCMFRSPRWLSMAIGTDECSQRPYPSADILFQTEWELRPSSPSAIRLIHFGKLLDDKTSLEGMIREAVAGGAPLLSEKLMISVYADAKFKNDTPNVVHMTVKPQDIVDEEDAKLAKQGGRDRDGNERSPGCRCVLM